MGCQFLLQGIFSTQGSNPGLPHCGRILYQLSHKGSHELRDQDKHLENVILNYFDSCSVQFSSVAQSCRTLRDPMNCSTPGLPVHHQLPVSNTQSQTLSFSLPIETNHILKNNTTTIKMRPYSSDL